MIFSPVWFVNKIIRLSQIISSRLFKHISWSQNAQFLKLMSLGYKIKQHMKVSHHYRNFGCMEYPFITITVKSFMTQSDSSVQSLGPIELFNLLQGIFKIPFQVLYTSVNLRFLAGIWVTASLLKSLGLFSVFWPFSIMVSFGQSPLGFLFSNPLILVPVLCLLFQEHQL